MDTVVATSNEQKQGAHVYVDNRPKTIAPSVQDDMPLEIYSQEHSEPYIYNLFEIDSTLPSEIKDQVSQIDDYIHVSLENKGLKSTTQAYKNELSALKRSLGISEDTMLEVSINRMGKYIEAEKMIKGIKAMDEDRLLYLLKKSKTGDFMKYVIKEIAKRGL